MQRAFGNNGSQQRQDFSYCPFKERKALHVKISVISTGYSIKPMAIAGSFSPVSFLRSLSLTKLKFLFYLECMLTKKVKKELILPRKDA